MQHIYLRSLFTLTLLLGACHTPHHSGVDALTERYQHAVADAQIAEPSERAFRLVAITPDNKQLKWKTMEGADWVLVSTWTNWNGYRASLGKEMTIGRELWVTSAPELQNFCHAYALKDSEKTLRLEQLLGLPPHNGKTQFIEMWVKPENLFRPSGDNEINDKTAETTLPTKAAPDYAKWYHDLESKSYGKDGYPWTRLGYTYDWGSNASEIGLSEFVLRPGSVALIQSITPTNDYCK